MQLTVAQVDLFQQEGYLILPNFFNQREVKAMQQELTRFYQQDMGVMWLRMAMGKPTQRHVTITR